MKSIYSLGLNCHRAARGTKPVARNLKLSLILLTTDS